MRTYYYVFNSTERGFPTVRHLAWSEAFNEAKRLHALQPGDTFEIYQFVGCVRPKLEPELVIAEGEA